MDTTAVGPEQPYRTTYSAHVSEDNVGASVRLAGWVARRRDQGGVYFFDLKRRALETRAAARRVPCEPDRVRGHAGQRTDPQAHQLDPAVILTTIEIRRRIRRAARTLARLMVYHRRQIEVQEHTLTDVEILNINTAVSRIGAAGFVEDFKQGSFCLRSIRVEVYI